MESWGVEVIRPWGLRTGRWPLFTTTAPLSGNFLVKCHFLLYFPFAFTRNLYHGLGRTSIFRQGSPLKHNRCWKHCETGQKRKGGTSLVVHYLWWWYTPHAGAQVRSLVRELRSHTLHGLKKKKERKKKKRRHGDTVDKKLPASAGDTGWISGLGRFHMSQGN